MPYSKIPSLTISQMFFCVSIILLLIFEPVLANSQNEYYEFGTDPTSKQFVKSFEQDLFDSRFTPYFRGSSMDSAYYIPIIKAICLCLIPVLGLICVLYCFCYTFKTKEVPSNNLVEDNWTLAEITSVPGRLDQPLTYNNHSSARILEHAPSAPAVAFVDVNGKINDDPPSYYEVMAVSSSFGS